ncbi:MAG: 30S ribosomal protein S16 [Endomicrobiia bacterium]
MALRIRLQRVGKKNRPIFRICVIERKESVKGKPVEVIGVYDPIKKKVEIDTVKYQQWIKCGASPSDTVEYLIKKVQKDAKIKAEIISTLSSK